jgi:ribosomal protein S18 acetylase RimI-like enzyme
MNSPAITVVSADSPALVDAARRLFEEYAAGLGIDLSYQDFSSELAGLPGAYAPPDGCLLVGFDGTRPAGCVALRDLGDQICEMKRLYVQPRARRLGLGRGLVEAAVAFARGSRYRALRLDTIPSMTAAQSLYRSLGFREIPAYCFSPVPGPVYLELTLAPSSAR